MAKHCPLCLRIIEEWECLCGICWDLVKWHDEHYGTHNIELFLKGEHPRQKEMEVHRQ